MSRDLNKVQLIGRLGGDPELKYTTNGSAVCTLRVATSREYTTNDERKQETEWTQCVAWNKLAEVCAQYLRKGSRLYIEGRLQTRSWDDQTTGQKRYMTEVIVDDMIMLDARPSGFVQEDDGGSFEEAAPQAERERRTPAELPRDRQSASARQTQARRSVAHVAQPTDDDDLPF